MSEDRLLMLFDRLTYTLLDGLDVAVDLKKRELTFTDDSSGNTWALGMVDE